MKKILIIILLWLPIIAGAQNKQTASPAVKVFGIPLGITAKEFNEKVSSVRDNIAKLLHVDEAGMFLNMYEGFSDDAIVWQVFIKAKNKYTPSGAASSRIVAILSAKYGTPHISQTCDGIECLRWDIKGGYIQSWNEKEKFYLQVVDYNALKQAEPELYKML